MKSLVVSAAALALVATPSLAADVLYTVPVVPTVAIDTSVHDWTGPYLGLSIGGQRVAVGSPSLLPDGGTGVVGGAYAGYNWQRDHFVFGLEGGLGYSAFSATQPCANAAWDCTVSLDWHGSLVGRVGVAADAVLFYLAGGVAGAHLGGETVNAAGDVFADSETRYGYTVGGGIEVALTDNMTGRIDYRYADYGVGDFDFDVAYPDVSFTSHAITLGISFAF